MQSQTAPIQPGRRMVMERTKTPVGLQPWNPGGILARPGKLRGDRDGVGENENAGNPGEYLQYCASPHRRRIRWPVVEKGAGHYRESFQRLVRDTVRLRVIRAGEGSRTGIKPEHRPGMLS